LTDLALPVWSLWPIVLKKSAAATQEDEVIHSCRSAGFALMMGHRQVERAALLYEFSLEMRAPPIICSA
jgi:hypothetical protein